MEKACVYWLCSMKSLGSRTVDRLLEYFGTAEAVYRAPERELRLLLKEKKLGEVLESRRDRDPQREFGLLQERGIGFLAREDPEYPRRLLEIPDAPRGIFYLGRLPEEERLSVAVIGARDCSEYGRFVAEGLGRELGRRGVQVVSGMARGIDGIGQRAALEAGGSSFGVLGCGVDLCYPRQNRELYERLREKGGLLSTFAPGTPALARNFPPRNRIVSGLADAVVVVEARQKSGTLITVDMALEQGKEVYVVPGRVTDRLSDGCNRLLKQGAGIFLSPAEFAEEMEELFRRKTGRGPEHKGAAGDVSGERDRDGREQKKASDGSVFLAEDNRSLQLSEELAAIYGELDFYPKSVSQIQAGLSERYGPRKVGLCLMELCVRKLAVQVSPGSFRIFTA